MSEEVTEIARKLAAEFVQHFGLDFPEDRSDDGTCSTCVAMTEKVLRSYGDTRERAGIERAAKLRDALSDLMALVRGECPALLDGDRGGDGALSIHIDALLRPAPVSQEPER